MTENEKKGTDFPNDTKFYKGTEIPAPQFPPLLTESHMLTSTDETEKYIQHHYKKQIILRPKIPVFR